MPNKTKYASNVRKQNVRKQIKKPNEINFLKKKILVKVQNYIVQIRNRSTQNKKEQIRVKEQKKGEEKRKIKLPVNISISDFNIFSSKLRDKFPKNNVAADFPTDKGEGVKKKKKEIEYDNEYKIINIISFHFILFTLIEFNLI